MQYAYKNGKILNGTKEMHVHLAGNGKPQKKQRDNAKLVKTLMSNGISRAIAYRMVAGFAKDELLSGVTTIRTVGGLGTFDTRLRDEIKAGKKLTLDNDTFENTGKSRFFERRTSRVLY